MTNDVAIGCDESERKRAFGLRAIELLQSCEDQDAAGQIQLERMRQDSVATLFHLVKRSGTKQPCS